MREVRGLGLGGSASRFEQRGPESGECRRRLETKEDTLVERLAHLDFALFQRDDSVAAA